MHALAVLSLMLLHLMYPPAVSAQGHWVRQETPVDHNLINLDFVDRSHGWVVGIYGTVLCTMDGGESWEIQQPGTPVHLRGVDFVDVHNGWIVGWSRDDSFVARTRDGGRTWIREMEEVLDPHSYPESVAFLDTLVGWVPADWKLFHTVDGGMNWVTQPSPPRAGWTSLMGIQFLDAQAGWVIGWPPATAKGSGTYIARTTDGGSTWEDLAYKVGVGPYNGLLDLDFVDREYGWIVGDTGLIWHTEDGGGTWEIQGSMFEYIFSEDWFYGVDFVNREEGWIVGCVLPWKTHRGLILHTKDGGRHWTEEAVKGEPEIPGLTALQLLDEGTGWCVGVDGTVLRYVPEHPTSVEEPASSNAPETYALFPNYPNPFNAETMIRYTLPEPARIRLVIYDVLGREVRALVDKEQIAGQHSVIWDGEDGEGELVSSGVYFYRLDGGEGHREVRRMLLLR